MKLKSLSEFSNLIKTFYILGFSSHHKTFYAATLSYPLLIPWFLIKTLLVKKVSIFSLLLLTSMTYNDAGIVKVHWGLGIQIVWPVNKYLVIGPKSPAQ